MTNPTSAEIELSELGLDESSVQDPSVSNFPTKFASRGFANWREILISPDYLYFCLKNPSLNAKWKFVTEAYVVMCNRQGLYPWKTSGEMSKVSVARYLLQAGRLQVKRYFKEIDLFSKVKVLPLKSATTRKYTLQKDKFGVQVTAYLQPITDPDFVKWLMKHPPKGPLFRRTGSSGQYTRRLYGNQDIEVVVTIDTLNARHPILTVNMVCNFPITLPYHGRPLTKAYILRYVEEQVWLPIARTHRLNLPQWHLF